MITAHRAWRKTECRNQAVWKEPNHEGQADSCVRRVKLKVALPRSGGMEVSSPTAADDPIGFSQYLAANGEGIKGIALRVDNIQEAMDELKSKGVEIGVYFEHNLMKECIIPPQPKTHNIEVALNEFPDEDPVGQAVARDMGIDLYA